MKFSYRHRFESGRFPCPTYYLLGYDTNEEDEMVIDEEGARTVRVIFFAYCLGYAAETIAEILTRAGRRTGWQGRDQNGHRVYHTRWSKQSVLYILENERYCGDIRGQKTFTQDPLTHQKRVNRGEYPSYFQTEHHEGSISHEVFAMTQRILKTEKYRQKAQMQSLELAVVQKGLLKGFIPLHQFSAMSNYQEYQALCVSVKWCEEAVSSIEIPNVSEPVHIGDVLGFSSRFVPYQRTNDNGILYVFLGVRTKIRCKDAEKTSAASYADRFSDFYRLRSEYGCRHQAVRLTLTGRKIECSQRLFELMHGVEYFELLLHPEEYLLAIRKTDSSNPNAIHWASWADGCCKRLKGAVGSISESIFDLMNWERDWKFTCEGHCRTRNGETILLFALRACLASSDHRLFGIFSPWLCPKSL